MRYFIASRWRNKQIVLELFEKLKEKVGENNVYCFFNNQHNIYSTDYDAEQAMQEFEAIKDWRNNKFVKDIFISDLNELKKSDAVILLLPAGKSAHMEIGIAYGLGKKCILIGETKETESLYLLFDEFYNSIDDFIKSL